MEKSQKNILIAVFSIFGIILAFFVSYGLKDFLTDNNQGITFGGLSWLLDVLYVWKDSHYEMSVLNILVTIICGIFFGILAVKLIQFLAKR